MARTQQQREQELEQRKALVLRQIAEAEAALKSAEQELEEKYFPSEEKFKPWALAARAADPKREITPKEFMKDFYKDLVVMLKKHREQLNLGDVVVKEWEDWFNDIDAEDMAALEVQIDDASIPLSAIKEAS